MILDKQAKQTDVETYGTEESIDMSIDSSDQAALMMILSENLYKDPIGSLIRESASNGLDAKKKAGNDQPIVVKLVRDHSYNYTFSVTDYGTGITPEEVKNVLSKYAASTKRGSNDYLGYYGLGFKAPLAYVDSFIFSTRVGGIEYQYLMYKGEKGTKIDLIDSHPTDSSSGTTVEVTVKKEDAPLFISKMKEQLAYFEGVYFDTVGIPGGAIYNDFKIIKSEDWKYSGLRGTLGNMHICLSDVYYEIDWNKLGIGPIPINIGLNFSLEDGLMPIPSREDIKYTEDIKKLIKAKIVKVADYFMQKYNDSRVDADYFGDIYNKFSYTFVDIEGIKFDASKLQDHATNQFMGKPKLKGIELLDLEWVAKEHEKIFNEYEIIARNYDGSFQSGKFYGYRGFPNLLKKTDDKYIIIDELPKGVQLEYLKAKYPYAMYLRKTRVRVLGTTDNLGWMPYGENLTLFTYRQLLRLSRYPKDKWRQVIKEYESIKKSIFDRNTLQIKDLAPTQEWLEERKARRQWGGREASGNERLWLKLARKNERVDWDNGGVVFEGQMIPIKEIGKRVKTLIVYGDKTQIKDLQHLGWMQYINKQRITLAIVNRSEQKKLKKLKNFISIDKFMGSDTAPFRTYATAILISKLISANSRVFDSSYFFSKFREQFGKDLKRLTAYKEKYYPRNFYGGLNFLDEVLKVAKEHKLFDEEMMIIYNRVKETIPQFADLELLGNYIRDDKEDTIKAVNLTREVLKHRGVRMDWENYKGNIPELTEEGKYEFEDESEESPLLDEDEEEEEEEDNTEAAPLASEFKILDLIPAKPLSIVAVDDWDLGIKEEQVQEVEEFDPLEIVN